MSEFKELLGLLDKFSGNALIVSLIRYIIGAFEAQLSAWHRQEHQSMCELKCDKDIVRSE